MNREVILSTVEAYYTDKIKRHGPCPRGVDWNSSESQLLRFDRLLSVCDCADSFTVNDYGCGYGALLDFLRDRGIACQYRGFDLSPAMIEQAQRLHEGLLWSSFFSDAGALAVADYTLASGIFNVRLETPEADWKSYMRETIDRLAALSSRGFSFNALTSYSDRDKMRPDLYYADPLFWFDYCRSHFSRFVALLHDYPLYEFTIIVRMGK
jgi:SAM-dependent methyltransferase